MSLWDKLIGKKQAGDTPGFSDHPYRDWEEGWWEGLTPNLRDSLRGWETEQSYLVSERQVQGADVQPGEMILFSLNEHLSLPGPRGGESTIPYAGGAFISRANDLYESIYGRAMPAVLTDSEKRHMLSEHRRRIRSGAFWKERRMNRQEYLWGRQDADVQTEFYTAQEGPGATRLGGYQGYLRSLGRYGAWAGNESFDDFLGRLDSYNRYTFRRHATDQVDLLEYQHLAGRQRMSRAEEEARKWPEYRGHSYAEARDFLEPYSYDKAATGWRRTLLDVTTIGKGVEFVSWARQEGASVFSVLDPFRHIPYWVSKIWSDEQLMDWADRTPWAKGWGGAMSFLSTVDDIEDALGFAGVGLWAFTGWYIMHPDQIVNRALTMPDSFQEAFYPSEQKLFEPPWGEDGALPWLYSHWMQLAAWGLGARALWRNTALSWPKRKVVWQPFKEVRLGTIFSLGLRLESTIDLQKPQGKGFWRQGFAALRTQQLALQKLGQLREIMSESTEVAELYAGQWEVTAGIVDKMQQRPLMGMFQALDPFTRRANLNPLGGVGQLELLDPENLPKEMTWSTGMWRLLVPRMAGYFEASKVSWWHGVVPQALEEARKGVLRKWGEIDTEIRAGLEDYLEHYPDRQPPTFGQDAYLGRIVGGWLQDRGREIWNVARRLPGLSGLVSGVEALRIQEQRLIELYGLGVEQLTSSVEELLAGHTEWERGLRYASRWKDAMPVLRGDTTVHETALQQLVGSDFTSQASGIQSDILRLQGRVGRGARAAYGFLRRMGWASGDHLSDLRITDRNWALGWLGVAQGQVRLESITDLQAETETPGYHFYDPMIRAGRRIMTILDRDEYLSGGMGIERPPSLPLTERLLARLPRVADYLDMGKELWAEKVRSEERSFGVGTSYRGEDQNPFSPRRNLIPWLAEEYRALRLFQRRALEMEHIHASTSTGVAEGKEYSRVWNSMEKMRQRRHFRLISLLEPLARRFDFGRVDLLYGEKVPQSEWYASTHPEATDADRRTMRATYRRAVLQDWPQYARMIRGGMRRHRVKLPFTKMGDAFSWFGKNMPPEFRGGGGMWGDVRYLWRGMGDLRAQQRALMDIGLLADEIVGYMEGDAWRELQATEREMEWLKESKRGLVTLSDDKEMIALAWAEQSKIDTQRKELRTLGDRVVRMQEDLSVYRDTNVKNSFEKLFKQFFPEDFEVYHTRMEAGTTESLDELTRMAMLRHVERYLGGDRVAESNFLREASAWLPMVTDPHYAIFKFGGVAGGERPGEWSVADLQRDVHRLKQLDRDAFDQFLEATYDWYEALEGTEEVSTMVPQTQSAAKLSPGPRPPALHATNWRWTGSGLEKVGPLGRGDDVWFERNLIRIAKSFRGAHSFSSVASDLQYLVKARDVTKKLVGEDPLSGIVSLDKKLFRYDSQGIVGFLQELISEITVETPKQADLFSNESDLLDPRYQDVTRGIRVPSDLDVLQGMLQSWSHVEDLSPDLLAEGTFWRYGPEDVLEEVEPGEIVHSLLRSFSEELSRSRSPDAVVLESMTGILRGLNVAIPADLWGQVSLGEAVDILRQSVSGQLAIPFEGTDVPGKVKMYERVRNVKKVAERVLRLDTEPGLAADKGFARRLRDRIRELGIDDYLFYGSQSRTEASERLTTFAEDLRDLGLRQLEASNVETFSQVEAMVRRELAEFPLSDVPQVLRDLVAAGPDLPADAKPIYRRERTGQAGKTWREGISPTSFDAALERGDHIIDAYGGPREDMIKMMNQLLAFVEEMDASDRVRVARKYERFLRYIPGLSRADMLYKSTFQMRIRELEFKKWAWDEKSKTDAPNVLRSHGWSAEWMLNPLTRLRELKGVRVPGEGINFVRPLWQRLQAWRVEIGRRAPSSSVWDRLASPMIARGIAQADLGEREINGKPLRELLPDLKWRQMAKLGEYEGMEVPGRSPRVTGGLLARGWEVARPRVIGGALVVGAGLAAGLGALGKKGFGTPWKMRPRGFVATLVAGATVVGGTMFFGSDAEGKRVWNRRLLGIPGLLGLVPDEPTVDISQMESGDVLWGRATVHPLYSKKVVGLTLEDVEYIDMPGDEAAPYRLMIGGAFDRLEFGQRFPPWAGQFGSYSVDAIRFAPLLSSRRVDMSGVDLLDPLWGIEIAEEFSGVAYDRGLYPYPPSLEALLQARDGLVDAYTGEGIPHHRLADIEHVVSLSEAHASGLWRADEGTRRMFASDLANLALASEEINRLFKGGRDAGEWLPATREAQLRYAQTVVNIKRRYGLSMDPREAGILRRILEGEFIPREEVLSGEVSPAEQLGIMPGSGRMLTPDEWSHFGLDDVEGLEEAAVTDAGTLVVWGSGWGVDYENLPPGTIVPEGPPIPWVGNWLMDRMADWWRSRYDPDGTASNLELVLGLSAYTWEKPTGEETKRWWRTDWSPDPSQHRLITALQHVGRFALHHSGIFLSMLPAGKLVLGLDVADHLGFNLRFRTEAQRKAQDWAWRRAEAAREPTEAEKRWDENVRRMGRWLLRTDMEKPWQALGAVLSEGWEAHAAAQRAARAEEPIARLRAWLAQDDAPASGFRIREDAPIQPRMNTVYLPFVASGVAVEEEAGEKQGWAASLWGNAKDALRNFLPRRVNLRQHAREREQNLLGYEREYRTYLPLSVRDGDPIGHMIDAVVGFQIPAAAVGTPGPPTKEEVEAMIREAVPVVVRQMKEDTKPAVRQQEVEGDADDLKLEKKVREVFGRMIRMSAESQNTPLLY